MKQIELKHLISTGVVAGIDGVPAARLRDPRSGHRRVLRADHLGPGTEALRRPVLEHRHSRFREGP